MNVGIAWPAFILAFKKHFPQLKRIETEEQIKSLDLIIFSGGEDINPTIYGEENSKSYGINDRRDAYELAVLKIAEKYGRAKYLGVCRGHQLLNAAFGGKLVQDIAPRHKSWHNLSHKKDDAFEKTIFPYGVNSLHHQGVIIPGKHFVPISTHKDGIIESTISDRVLSVQYHPEFLSGHGFFEFVENWVTK